MRLNDTCCPSDGVTWYSRTRTVENEDIKAAVVERFNRTLKGKMYRYFTAKHTRRYVDVLPEFLHSYTRTYHRSVGMAPVEVTPENEGYSAGYSARSTISRDAKNSSMEV